MTHSPNEEYISGHLVSSEMKKIWSIEIDMAKHLLEVCKKYSLRIWSAGGTLLGAVRHKGFIPWDDDMDFCMLRDDYNKLLRIGPEEFKYPYFFQSVYTDRFWGGMIKIRRSDTAMIMSSDLLLEYNMGIFIDVFVMDAIPNNSKKFNSMYRRVKFYRKLYNNKIIVYTEYLPIIARIKHHIVTFFFRFFKTDILQKRIEVLLSSNSIADCEECGLIDFSACRGHDVSRILLRSNKHCYDETIELPFMDISVPAPIGYDEVLRRQYGDYMIPQKGGQFHTSTVVNCEKPFKDLLPSMREKKHWSCHDS